jgi:hypothetical protein
MKLLDAIAGRRSHDGKRSLLQGVSARRAPRPVGLGRQALLVWGTLQALTFVRSLAKSSATSHSLEVLN